MTTRRSGTEGEAASPAHGARGSRPASAADPPRKTMSATKPRKATKPGKAAKATKATEAAQARSNESSERRSTTATERGAQDAAQAWDARRWPRVVVFGAGAVGCYFGAKLAQAGAPVTLIGRSTHMDPIRADGLRFESGGLTQEIAIGADTQSDPLRDADLVLLCVKTLDTDAAARTIAALAPPKALVVSMQNGVDNVERIARAADIDAMAAVVYVAASMPGPGQLRHGGRGDLVLGEYGAPPAERSAPPTGRSRSPRSSSAPACPVPCPTTCAPRSGRSW